MALSEVRGLSGARSMSPAASCPGHLEAVQKWALHADNALPLRFWLAVVSDDRRSTMIAPAPPPPGS